MDHTFSSHLSKNEQIKEVFTVSMRARTFAIISGGVLCFVLWLGISYYSLGIVFQPVIAVVGTLAVALFYTYILLYNYVYLPRAFSYALTNERVIAKRGILGNVFISVSYENITDITLQQTFIERTLFNSGTVFVNTSGSSMIELTLPGIDDPASVKRQIHSFMDE